MPEKMIRVPLHKARELRLIDERTDQLLTDPKIHEKAFNDPNLGNNQTYTELLEMCHVDQKSGLTMLILKGSINSKISIKEGLDLESYRSEFGETILDTTNNSDGPFFFPDIIKPESNTAS